jgi:hypothetical protein
VYAPGHGQMVNTPEKRGKKVVHGSNYNKNNMRFQVQNQQLYDKQMQLIG